MSSEVIGSYLTTYGCIRSYGALRRGIETI